LSLGLRLRAALPARLVDAASSAAARSEEMPSRLAMLDWIAAKPGCFTLPLAMIGFLYESWGRTAYGDTMSNFPLIEILGFIIVAGCVLYVSARLWMKVFNAGGKPPFWF
jgi:hypothetical protein